MVVLWGLREVPGGTGRLLWGFLRYDSTHLARTEHYRNFVFAPRSKLVARGGFIEDPELPGVSSAWCV